MSTLFHGTKMMTRTTQFLSRVLVVLFAAAMGLNSASAQSADPYKFEKKAYKPDGTPWSGPVNVGDIVKYVLSYKPGTTNSGPVTIDDTLSPNQTYVAPTTSSPGWTWGSSPYSTGNHEQYVNSGFGPGSGFASFSFPSTKKDGDGTRPIPVGQRVYGVYHHSEQASTDKPGVDCWELSTLTKCAGYPKPNATGVNQIATPLIPDAVVRGTKIFFPGFRGVPSGAAVGSGAPTIGCFDTMLDAPCADTLIDPSLGTIGTHLNIGGLSEDPISGNVFVAVQNKLLCRNWNSTTWINCANWPLGGKLATPTPQANSVWGSVSAVHVEHASAPSKVYVHVGVGWVQCFDIITSANCASWPTSGVSLGASGSFFSSVPAGSNTENGVCLWNINSNALKCVDASGAILGSPTPAVLAGASTTSSFRLPNSKQIFFPRHVASAIPPLCFEFNGTIGMPCVGYVPVTPPTIGSRVGMQYGFSLDPLDPQNCLLALGDSNVLWSFNIHDGKRGCGRKESLTTPDISSLYCSGQSAPADFTWTSIHITTSGATGTLTLTKGSATQSITLMSGQSDYAINASIGAGPGNITFSFAPGTYAGALDFQVGYTSDKNPEICYQAKVSKCGPVFNDAMFKGSLNGAPISVAQKVDLGVAKGPECDPEPPQEASCLSSDPKVTCGKTPGTYVITLNPTGAGGIVPTSLQITSLTAGVTIVSPQAAYPVIGGQVKITLAGAVAGQSIDLDVEGTTQGAGSAAGTDLCCNGKIKVTIPKDLDCNPKSTVDITKLCDPAVYRKYPTKPNITAAGYVSMCHITVKTSGPQTGTLSVNDNLSGGTVVSAASTTAPPWVCAGSACTINGTTLNQTASTSNIDVMVVFPNTGDVKEGKNCAVVAANGKDVDKDCTIFTVAEKGKLTVIKEASYNGTHITNVNFPIAVTCGGTTTNATVADSAPYVQTNIPVGTNCSVVEGAAPPTGLCKKNQTEVWTTTYNPTTPVTATVAGATIKVRNILTCKDDVDSTIKVTKTCEPVKEVIGAINSYVADCKITVTTTGPQTAPITVNEVMTGGGTVTSAASSTTPTWNCNTANCSINGGLLNQTASTSVIDVKVSFPTKGHALESENCARLSVGQNPVPKPQGESCTKFTVSHEEKTSISITKRVVSNAPDVLPVVAYPVTATCDSSVASVNDSQTITVGNLAVGTACTITEGALNTGVVNQAALDACGGVGNPVWTTTYAPSQTVNAGPSANVTITNTLNCEPVHPPVDNRMYIKKVVVNNSPGSLEGIEYDITSQCSNTTQPTGFAHFSDGETVLFHNYEAGMSCNLSEVIPATTACGKGMTDVWSTTYSPSQTVNLSPNGETITVTNTLNCAPIVNPTLSTFSVSKEASYDGEPILGTPFQMNVTCDDGTAQSLAVLSGQAQTINGLPVGTTCNVAESKIGTTNLCPKGSVEKWTTSYNPANGSNTTAANSSVVVRVYNLLTCEPIIIDNPLACDPASATQAGDLCRCRFNNMQQVSKTSCECKDGFNLKEGKGCEPIVVTPKCDPATTVTKGNACVCEYRNMVQVSKTACACAKGFKFAAGKGCFKPEPVCKKSERFQPARNRCEPVCAKGFEYSVKRNVCNPVRPDCPKDTVYNAKRNRCDKAQPVCRQPFVYDAKRNACVEVVKSECERGQIRVGKRCVAIPNCPFGQIPIPGTGICVSIGGGGGGGGGKEPPKCVPTPGRECQ